MTRRRLRFAFTIPSGPNAGWTLAGWRLWVSGEETYITAKTVGGVWKTSLHGDVAWRHAMTREHVESGRLPLLQGSEDRATWKFSPTPFIDGTRLAFVVAAARSCLRPGKLDAREAQIAVEDRWDRLHVAKVWMTEARADTGLAEHPRLLGDPFALSNGRRVWVTADAEAVASAEPEPVADSVILKPLWPEEHDVAAPGLLAVGARWG